MEINLYRLVFEPSRDVHNEKQRIRICLLRVLPKKIYRYLYVLLLFLFIFYNTKHEIFLSVSRGSKV